MVEIAPVYFRRLPHAAGIPLPAYAKPGDAGLDLSAAIDKPVTFFPNRLPQLIPTGFEIELMPGYEAQVRPRSGLTLKTGLIIPNSPGTIDAGYRGEVKVMMMLLGPGPVTINPGDRIAQLVIADVVTARVSEAHALSTTARGADGFGSTG